MLEAADIHARAYEHALTLPPGVYAQLSACLDKAIEEKLPYPECMQQMAGLIGSMMVAEVEAERG